MCCICTVGFISVSQQQQENKFLDSPVHGFNPSHEQEAPRDHLRTQVRRTREEFPVQSETNDGRAEVPLLILMLHSSSRHMCQCLQEHICCVILEEFHCLSSCSLLSLFVRECVTQEELHCLFSLQLVLHSQGWSVEMSDGGTTMW